MPSRLTRSAASLAIVVVAFCVYRIVVVPFIEPQIAAPTASSVSPAEIEQARGAGRRNQDLFAKIFPDGRWEREDPIVLESDQAMVLIKGYKNLNDGRVKIDQCTMLVFTSAARDPSRAIVIETSDGAELEFDQPFDLGKAQGGGGRLIGGKMDGPITVRQPPSSPEANDDLYFEASDFRLNHDQMWSLKPVRGRVGPNDVSGRELRINLVSGSGRGPGFRGVSSIELLHEVRMHLLPSAAGFLPGDQPMFGDANSQRANQVLDNNQPVDITCQGAFRFDLATYVASFEDRVNVIRTNPNGPSDQLRGEELLVYFERSGHDQSADSQTPPARRSGTRLQPRRIEARGNPLVVESPSNSAYARGTKMSFDIVTRQITLEHPESAELRQGVNEIHTRSMTYTPPPQRRGIGRLNATGTGNLRGSLSDDQQQLFEANWAKSLVLEPDEGIHRVSVTGDARVGLAGQGALNAHQIHLWLLEVPRQEQPSTQGQNRPPVLPQRMLATGKVEIDSTQLTGKYERLEVWFKQGLPVVAVPSTTTAQNRGQSNAPSSPVSFGASSPTASPQAQRHFRIDGDLLRVQLITTERTTSVDQATVFGNVYCQETRTATPGEQPLILRGNELELEGAAGSAATLVVKGEPAQVRARGLSLEGAIIQMHQGNNRLWVDGPGTMSLPVDRDMRGRPLAEARDVRVAWKGNMDFDGRTIRYSGGVETTSDAQLMRTQSMEAILTRRINFAEPPRDGQRPDVLEIICKGGVSIKSEEFEGPRRISVEQIQTQDLHINQQTGAILAQGPGWLESWRVGMDGLANSQMVPTGFPGGSQPAKDDEVGYLNVQFQREITGNLHNRELVLHERVQAVQGPVPSWNDRLQSRRLEDLGQRGVLITCNELQVTQMPGVKSAAATVELEARQNVLVEGTQFTARAATLKYDQSKDLLVLEGDGRTDAELYRQESVGGPRSTGAARRIYFWRTQNVVKVDGWRSLDMSQMGSPGGSVGFGTPR